MAPVLQGLGAALILAIIEQVRDRDEQTRAAASAEARAYITFSKFAFLHFVSFR
jgi:hypothetical protein